MKERLSDEITKRKCEEYKKELETKKSLGYLKDVYLGVTSKDNREVISRFIFGLYIWENKRKNENGERICPLCNGIESYVHLLRL